MTSESVASRDRATCVVIDTSVWRSQLLLKTPIGVSLVYTLGRQNGRLGLPEVVESELARNIIQAGLEAAQQAEKSNRILATLIGPGFPPNTTTQSALESLTSHRISEINPILERVPFSLDHAKAALEMVIAQAPPNGPKNQQFKDSAIWQAVLALSQRFSVHFVTEDLGFFQDRNVSKGLAANLRTDCDSVNGTVAIHSDLGSCLEAVTGNPPSFDRDRVRAQVEELVRPQLQHEAARLRFDIREVIDADVTAFRTDDPNRLAIDFTIVRRFEANSTAANYATADCRVIIYGSCYYDPASASISSGFVEEIRFLAKSPGGGSSTNARSFKFDDPFIPFPRPLPWT